MLLHPVHPLLLRVTLVRHRLKQRLQIHQHLPPRRIPHLPPRRRRADLLKQPRIPNRPPPQHQPPRPRLRQHPQRRLRRVHIPIRQHRTPHHLHRMRDEIVVYLRPIHLPHRPPVHRQNIRLMPRINRQQRLKLRQRRRLHPDPRLHRERHLRDRLPQRPQDPVNPRQIPQQPAPRALVEHPRRRTAQIQVNPRHRMLLQLLRRPHQIGHVIANHLQHHRPPCLVLRRAAQNLPVQLRVRRHPKILRKTHIRPAITPEQMNEPMVRHRLHRRQRQHRRLRPQASPKGFSGGSFRNSR